MTSRDVVTDIESETPAGDAPVLTDLDAPSPAVATSLSGSAVPPQQRIYFYSAEEWEQFIREWATGLNAGYVQIKRLGGPNDRGVDVAAFKTATGFEGAWDCFQGKHYADPLTLSDVVPEILKLLIGVVSGHYVMPDRYAFLAPQGCASSLNRLLSMPTELREAFLLKIAPGSRLVADMDTALLGQVRLLAEETDFSRFQSVEILDALEVHRSTPYFAARFAATLAPRPEVESPPDELASNERRYVAQLIEVYVERHPAETFSEPQLAAHPKTGEHFQRQRISFYSAEALRLYARDSVPEGTFEALQDDVHAGVIEVAESEHASGMERLSKVLTTSGQLDLSAHTLISVSKLDDRKGICHQLANEDRLRWIAPKP
jgi:hypothetical protein